MRQSTEFPRGRHFLWDCSRRIPARLALIAAGGFLLGTIGVALAVLMRHTIAVVGVAVGTGLLELLATLVGYVSSSPGSVLRWLPSTQLAAVFGNGNVVDAVDLGGSFHSARFTVPPGEGLLYWSTIAVSLAFVALLTFRRSELR